MNQYPAWKYLLILVILVFGTIYALPNLFGEDPAHSGHFRARLRSSLDRAESVAIDDALVVEQIEYKDTEQVGNRLLYRFNSTEDQQLQGTAERADRRRWATSTWSR